MARQRKSSTLTFDALTVEGSLIAPAMLARIAAQKAEEQKPADYRVLKGLALRDEIARYFRVGQALFLELMATPSPSTSATIKFTEELLRDVFGFADIAKIGARTMGEHVYAVTLEGLAGRVPVVVVPPSDDLDQASEHIPGGSRRQSAASATQDWLNANDDALWGICCNGVSLRLVRDNESLTRPAYIEADLRQMFENEAYADFSILWLLIHWTRFGSVGSPVTDCALERWRDAGAKEGVAARDRLRDGFEAALLALGTGFLDDPALRARVQTGDLPLAEFFGQLLRLVYRMIFLLVAEDRNLLHPPLTAAPIRRLYSEGYSLASLRDRAVRRASWDTHQDRWQGLLIAFAALRRGQAKLGLPALGGLFGARQLNDLEAARLPNRALMQAIFRLAWLRDQDVLTPVNWRDMETEELGSVYEGLLELTPRISGDGRSFLFAEGAETKGNARKTSGSYYTPDSLVQALLQTSLDPVLDTIEAEADDPAEALLGVTVIDPACGSGHFLLSAARRIATRVARARAGGVASAEDYRQALRDVARRCIYGVDRNPMAVELTKVALWIETVEPGKPLGFLDANIRCGDALLGVLDMKVLELGIPDEAYKPLTGDDKEAAKVLLKDNRSQREHEGDLAAGFTQSEVAREAERVLSLPENDVEEVERKRQAYDGWRKSKTAARGWMAANLYVGAFLRPKRFRETGMVRASVPDRVPTTVDVRAALAGRVPHLDTMSVTLELVSDAHVFHWPLEFPAVIEKGGFDLVVGNPPWERIKLQEQEFFASRAPEISMANNAGERRQLIKALGNYEPDSRERILFGEFERAKRTAEASSVFVRVAGDQGGRFPLTGQGDVNTYALFAELFIRLTSPRGQAGLIAPTGLITDFSTSDFFAWLVAGRRLISSMAFDNQRRVFPGIHADTPFTLLTLGTATASPEFAAYLLEEAHLGEANRRYKLAPEDIARINPNTKTAPVFRSLADAEITAKIYRQNSAVDDTGKGENKWELRVKRFLDMNRQDVLNRVSTKRSSGCVPVYEGKLFWQFDHRHASYANKGSVIQLRDEKLSPDQEVVPRYWIEESDVRAKLSEEDWSCDWLVAIRDLTNATNERTVIASAIPRAGTDYTIRTVLSPNPFNAALFLSCANTLVFDYVARAKLGGMHLAEFFFQQLALPSLDSLDADERRIVLGKVIELTYTSNSMAHFARDLGYSGPPFVWDEDRRALLRAELDAFYAKKYGLTRDELRYILDPADVMGADYPSETFRVLKNNDIKSYGEYRTARLVLDAWDRIERDGLTI